MAKSSTRRITIYINGKEVEASVKQIRVKKTNKRKAERGNFCIFVTIKPTPFAMEYENDSQTISPRNAPFHHCNSNESVHFATTLLTVNCQLSTVNWIHTFSAKEKDTETGLSYFGARYYSSDLSIWLSVDPMSDKYPHQSNYVYCSNNPIKVIDPNGEDEWDLARDGTLTKRENGRTDIDVVHATDETGNSVSLSLDAKSISEMKSTQGLEYGIDYMNIYSYDNAVDFFEFAANNTDVEWGLMVTDQGNFVGTSKEPLAVESGTMVPKGATVLEDIHSHIPGHDVDAADKNVARINYGNNITTKVYHADSKSYSEFEYTFYSESQKQPHVTVKMNRVPRK